MIADFCELLGWRGYFLGANRPLADLLQRIQEHRPDLLGLSLSIYFNLPALLKALDAVTRQYPDLPDSGRRAGFPLGCKGRSATLP